MWVCTICGEEQDDRYDYCWNCHTARRQPASTYVSGDAQPEIMLATTPALETHVIKQYLGLVAGEATLTASSPRELEKGIAADVAKKAGGRLESLKEARRCALLDATEQAIDMGANSIVGVSFDYHTLGSHLLIICHGTAVLVEKLVTPEWQESDV
jgi:uncharacterized protein YbjQ (UPF0145 family)